MTRVECECNGFIYCLVFLEYGTCEVYLPQFSTKVQAAGGDLSGGAGDNAVNFTTGRWTCRGLETGQ